MKCVGLVKGKWISELLKIRTLRRFGGGADYIIAYTIGSGVYPPIEKYTYFHR